MENKIVYRNCHESRLAQKYLNEESKDINKIVPGALGILATVHGEPDGEVHVQLQLNAPGRFRTTVHAAEPHMGQAMSEALKKLKRKVTSTRDKLQQPVRRREPWEERNLFIQEPTDDDSVDAEYLIKANETFYHHDDAKRIVADHDNSEIAAEFNELAMRLRCLGISKPWISSFKSTGRKIKKLNKPLRVFVEGKKPLKSVLKVGSKITEYVKEHSQTGRIKLLEQLRTRTPRDLEALLAIQGIGPKVAMKLYREHGINSIEDLQAKLNSEQLDSIGVKLQTKIKKQIKTLAA